MLCSFEVEGLQGSKALVGCAVRDSVQCFHVSSVEHGQETTVAARRRRSSSSRTRNLNTHPHRRKSRAQLRTHDTDANTEHEFPLDNSILPTSDTQHTANTICSLHRTTQHKSTLHTHVHQHTDTQRTTVLAALPEYLPRESFWAHRMRLQNAVAQCVHKKWRTKTTGSHDPCSRKLVQRLCVRPHSTNNNHETKVCALRWHSRMGMLMSVTGRNQVMCTTASNFMLGFYRRTDHSRLQHQPEQARQDVGFKKVIPQFGHQKRKAGVLDDRIQFHHIVPIGGSQS